MLTIRNEKFIKHILDAEGNKRAKVVAEIDVDTRAELPEPNSFPKKSLHQGSTALVISTAELFVLDGSGNWHDFTNGGE